MYERDHVYQRIEEAWKSIGCKNARQFSLYAEERGISISQGKLNNWKQHHDVPEISSLMDICNLCGVDIDYLLGNIENCKTRDHQFIHDETGLSEDAIIALKNIRESISEQYPITEAETDEEHKIFIDECVESALHGLSDLICKPDFLSIMDKIRELRENWDLNYKDKSVSDLNKKYIDSRQEEMSADIYFLEKRLTDLVESYIDGTEERK